MAMCAAEAGQAAIGSNTALRRIGVLGSMFDPIHLGHTNAALVAGRALGLEQVLLVPCGNPVHRRHAFASASERCAMVELAIAGEPLLQLDRREVRSDAPSYMIDTISSLQREQPGVSWYLLVGIDAFLGLPGWKQWQQLLDQVNLVVMTRPGYALDPDLLPPGLRQEWQQRQVQDFSLLAAQKRGAILSVDVLTPDLSSTRVRELIKTGGGLGSILHPAVAAHIRAHCLYLSGDTD